MIWYHVYPINDWIEHNTDSKLCVCEPIISWSDLLVVHNALDGRK